MSKRFLEFVNNLVDKEDSEHYVINKRRRDFWHSRSTTFSFRVRDKNDFNTSKEIAFNIREFLLGDNELFFDEVAKVGYQLREADGQQFRDYIYSSNPLKSKEELDKKIGLLILALTDEQKKGILHLEHVITCRILGYEKELFYLKCYCKGLLPVFMGRVLYHTRFNHLEYSEDLPEDFEEGIDISMYLDRIKFI